MGLFDKKKKGRDDFDSPVEQIDVSEPAAAVPNSSEAETVDFAAVPSALKSGPTRESGRRSRQTEARPAAPSYGIEDAIALMRTLPSENIELVVQVVKQTLESAHIDIGLIIDDATAKQQRMEARVVVLRDAITELEREIETRRTEIAQLEADHRETTRVKERLVLAEKLGQAGRADAAESAPAEPARRAEVPPPRNKPPTQPPPLPADPTSNGGTPALGSPTHLGSGSHPLSHPVGPGGPVGSYGSKAANHPIVPKK